MLTKVLTLVLVVLIGLALGVETARMVHAHATGGVASASSMVNIHRALLGFGLLATAGALLLSLRADRRGGLRFGAWLSRQWSRFTTWLELTLNGLFDFDALNVGDGTGPVVLRGDDAKQDALDDAAKTACTSCSTLGHWSPDCPASRIRAHPSAAEDGLLPCRGCSWCGVDPGDLPNELWTECDGSGRYLPNTEAERQRQLAHPKPAVKPPPGTITQNKA
jgi:hypothetical protein